MDTSPSIGTKEHIQWWRTWALFLRSKRCQTAQTQLSQVRVKVGWNHVFVAFPTLFTTKIGGKNGTNPSGTSRFLGKTSSFYLKMLWNFEGGPKIQTQKKNHLPPFTGPSVHLWSSKASSCFNFCQTLEVPSGMFCPRISRKIHSFPMSRIHPFLQSVFGVSEKEKSSGYTVTLPQTNSSFSHCK